MFDSSIDEPAGPHHPQSIERAIEAMQTRLADSSLSITELAGIAGLHRAWFSAAFRRATGSTPTDYLRNLRLERAKELLSTTSLEVDSIRSRVGYDNAHAFSARFRSEVGVGPKAYRARYGCISQQQAPITPTMRAIVEQAIEFMQANLGKSDLTLRDVARSVTYSRRQFIRTFRRVTNVTVGEYLTNMRMEEAKRLLETTSLKVSMICHKVGFESIGSFNKRFRSDVGLTPTTYRKQRAQEVTAEPGMKPNEVIV